MTCMPACVEIKVTDVICMALQVRQVLEPLLQTSIRLQAHLGFMKV